MKTERKVLAEQRDAERTAKVRAGIEKLDLWLDDLLRGGLGRLEHTPEGFEQQARRLVDAQARSLARRLQEADKMLDGRADWPERLLEELGRIALLTHAWKRLDALPETLRADVRGRIGWEMRRDEVLARGDRVRDVWTVTAVVTRRVDENLRLRRVWLQGRESGRNALLLRFAGGSRGKFSVMPSFGEVFSAELAFYPSAYPLRAEIAERDEVSINSTVLEASTVSTFPTIDAFLDASADALAQLPWLERLPCQLGGVVPVFLGEESDGDRWFIVDSRGQALPCSHSCPDEDLWTLLALSGGHPLNLIGEWDGRSITPLAAEVDGGLQALEPRVLEKEAES